MKSHIHTEMQIGIYEIKVTIFRNGRRMNVKWFDSNEYNKAKEYSEFMTK